VSRHPQDQRPDSPIGNHTPRGRRRPSLPSPSTTTTCGQGCGEDIWVSLGCKHPYQCDLDQVLYLPIFHLLTASSLNKILLKKGPRTARRASIDRRIILFLRGRPQEHVLPSAICSAHCVTVSFCIF
jgi:hypothetical protein